MGRRQLSKAGFKTYLIDWVHLSELNSDTLLVWSPTQPTTRPIAEKSSRMRDPKSDSGGLLDGHLGLDKTPV